jgi:glucokinase
MANNQKSCTIGIDIGGTKMSGVLFDGEKVLADFILATPKDSLEHFMIMVKALVEPLEEKAAELKLKIDGIGVGLAAALDSKREKALFAPNIKIINNINIKQTFEQKLDREVMIDNDVNCFMIGERTLGAAKKYGNVFAITIGTGVGGAWYNNGGLYFGAHGMACEPGHMIVDFSEMIDFEKAYQRLCQNNAEQMALEAYRGDVLAEKAYEEIGRMLGIVAANIINLIDPEAIVIGGSVINSGDLFLSAAKRSMREHIVSSEAKRIKLVKSKLGALAGAIGAAIMAKKEA